VALLGIVGGMITVQATRIREVENRLNLLQSENNKLWLWARSLVDYAYTYRVIGAPALPIMPVLNFNQDDPKESDANVL